MTISVSRINLYPVKSLGGISLHSTHLGLSGLDHDREWMVTRPDGSFLTLRSHPQMAMVQASMEGAQLILRSFGMESYKVPPTNDGMQHISTEVWGDSVLALDTGDETAHWLSQAIGDACRLVAFPADQTRKCDPEYSESEDHTKFADGFPLLIISEESLQDLNGRLSVAVSMDRFRPNIVVSGCEAFSEDAWKTIEINGLPLRVVKSCARCSVPTVDPETGVMAGPEPIHTLSSYRQRDGEVFFGMNATPDREGNIKVGDEIVIT